MGYLRQTAWVGASSLLLMAALAVSVSAQKNSKDGKDQKDDPRPKVSLRAQPVIAMAPARVVLTADPGKYQWLSLP